MSRGRPRRCQQRGKLGRSHRCPHAPSFFTIAFGPLIIRSSQTESESRANVKLSHYLPLTTKWKAGPDIGSEKCVFSRSPTLCRPAEEKTRGDYHALGKQTDHLTFQRFKRTGKTYG